MLVIPDTWEVEIEKIKVPGQHWQKAGKTPFSINKLAWWLKPVIICGRPQI
jgi:hypothetical protein